MAPATCRWTKSLLFFRSRSSAIASGWFRCMTRADEISEIGKQYETKPGFYGDTANLSRCFCCPAIFTLCVNPQSVGERLK